MLAPTLIAFDVNETLLSLEPMGASIESLFGPNPPVGEWFARLLHGSLVANTLDRHRPFADIAVEALVAMGVRRGLVIEVDDAERAIAPMRVLRPHPEVADAIARLSAAGLSMIALTNGGEGMARSQVDNAGLGAFLERVVSVDEVAKFKPHPAPYRHAADLMGVPIGEMLLVAAHDWDCAGALAAGARSVFVERPGVSWGVAGPRPELTVRDLRGLADALGV